MTNRQKAKGDREEREVLTIARQSGFPWAERTRPGRREDQGDIHLAPGIILQCKDVATPQWRQWFDELAQQKHAAGADHAILTVKRRGTGGRPPLRLAVMPLDAMLQLLCHAGWGDPDHPQPACFVCGSRDDRPTGCGPECLDADIELADRYSREGDHQ